MRFFLSLILFALLTFPGSSDETAGDSPQVYVIPLRGEVDRHMGVFLSRSLEEAEKAGAETVIIEIDTFGGRVDTALEIASRLGSSGVKRTVAYVPADAGGRGVSWSAGALMAFSCTEIWMAPGTSLGAAAPVYQTAEGMEMAQEKTVSAVRGQMAALAEKNGYPVGVALAMVDQDVVLKEITLEGKLLLMPREDIEVLQRDEVPFREGRVVSAEGKLLTLTAGEMERYGISSGTLSPRGDLITALKGNPEQAVVLEKGGADRMVAILTSAGTTTILLLLALVALYMEITSPGFGVPGTIALIAFALVFGGSALMGNLGAVELLLFLAGVVLLLVEIFIIPGFGVAGISGILLILISLTFSLQDFYWPAFDWQWGVIKRNLLTVGGGLAGAFTAILILMAALPRSGLFGRLVLKDPADPSPPEGVPASDSLLGKKGLTLTTLRPVGKARIDEKIMIVETEGTYVPPGASIEVIRVEGFKIFVKEEGK